MIETNKNVIIAGNGLSRLNFNFADIKKGLNCPLYVCNLAYKDLPYDKVFAIDDQVLDVLRKENIPFVDVPEYMKWEPREYNPYPPRNNSGMVAMQWAIHEGYTNLHLFGFDFILNTEQEKMSNVYAGHPLYGPETACSYTDSFARMRYLEWMRSRNPGINFNFYFPEISQPKQQKDK